MRHFAIALLCTLVQAQSNLDLTLTFTADSADTCSTDRNASGSAVTFSTFDWPDYEVCLNLDDIFASNGSSGQRIGDEGFKYSVANVEHFDRNANYSRIWYQQVNASGSTGNDALGSFYFLLFPERRCHDASDYLVRPIYVTSCQSEEDGECHRASYSVKSIAIFPIDQYFGSGYSLHYECTSFLPETGGARMTSGRSWAMAAAVAVGILMI